MFIKKVEKERKKKFVFVLSKPDGSEYETAIFSTSKTEAEKRLNNALDIVKSRDEIVKLKRPSSEQ